MGKPWLQRQQQRTFFELPLLTRMLRDRGFHVSVVETDDLRELRDGPPSFLRIIWTVPPFGNQRKTVEALCWANHYDHRMVGGKTLVEAEYPDAEAA